MCLYPNDPFTHTLCVCSCLFSHWFEMETKSKKTGKERQNTSQIKIKHESSAHAPKWTNGLWTDLACRLSSFWIRWQYIHIFYFRVTYIVGALCTMHVWVSCFFFILLQLLLLPIRCVKPFVVFSNEMKCQTRLSLIHTWQSDGAEIAIEIFRKTISKNNGVQATYVLCHFWFFCYFFLCFFLLVFLIICFSCCFCCVLLWLLLNSLVSTMRITILLASLSYRCAGVVKCVRVCRVVSVASDCSSHVVHT